jgi:hypothetical protein
MWGCATGISATASYVADADIVAITGTLHPVVYVVSVEFHSFGNTAA